MTEFHTPIARVEKCETHPDEGLDHLSIITVLGKKCISGNLEDGISRYKVGDLVLFCPVNAIIPLDFLKFQGFYWDAEKNRGLLKGSKRNRVGPVARGSVISEGLLFPVGVVDDCVYIERDKSYDPYNFITVEEGQDISTILGITEFKG